MRSLCFWFVNFILDTVYKFKNVFIMVLDGTKQIMATCLLQFAHLTTKTKIHKIITELSLWFYWNGFTDKDLSTDCFEVYV